jgi:hypothetical protein
MSHHPSFLTEEQAHTKICPHIRLGVPNYDMHNDQVGITYVPDCCIASKCMAWRWVSQLSRHVEGDRQIENIRNEVGYCGLAGKP